MEFIALTITPDLARFLNDQRMSGTPAEVLKAEVLQKTGDGINADISVTFRIPAGKIYVDVFNVRWDAILKLGGLDGVVTEPYEYRPGLTRILNNTPGPLTISEQDWSLMSPGSPWRVVKSVPAMSYTMPAGASYISDVGYWSGETGNIVSVSKEGNPPEKVMTSRDVAASDKPLKRAIEL